MRFPLFGLSALALISLSSPAFAQEKKDGSWRGNIAANFAQIQTAASTRSFSLFGAAKRVKEKSTTTLDQTYVSARQRPSAPGASYNTTDDAWTGNASHTFTTGQRTNGFVNARLQTDRIQNLRLRSIVGGGLGILWRDTPRMSFKTNVGVAYIREDFKGLSVKSKASGQFGYLYSRTLASGTKFTHDFTIFPNFSDTSDNYYVAQFGLDHNIAGNLTFNVRYITDRTANPAPGTPRTTSRLLFGVGTKF